MPIAGRDTAAPEVLATAPAELTAAPLLRLGEGIGKVVYASPNWVVKRERTTREIMALVLIWRLLRRFAHWLPGRARDRLLSHPTRRIRALKVALHAVLLLVPRWVWFARHAFDVWRVYNRRNRRGEALAARRLAGTELIPQRIAFPPVEVRVGGWPGWLKVDEATERVETTLHERLETLARAGRFGEIETWLDRLLEMRRAAWQRGVFSVDAHLKNFGVHGDRVVLLDAGGLTDHWGEIERRLGFEDGVQPPHARLGLASALRARPDIAEVFDSRWRAAVNPGEVQRHWPLEP